MKTNVFKRIFSFILTVLTLMTLVSAGTLNASAYTATEIAKKRMDLVNYFHAMATVKWTAGQNFTVKAIGEQQYYKGNVYYGFPYASIKDSQAVSLESFNKELNRTGGYLNKPIGQSDCSTTLGVAYNKKIGISQVWNVSWFANSSFGFNKVSSYSELLPGDVLVRYNVSGSSNHVMMVVSVNKTDKTVTVTHQAGNLYVYNPSKDTTGFNKAGSTKDRNCSWGVNQVWTYDSLNNDGYKGYVYKDLKMPLAGDWVTINYNGNGGSGATASQTIAQGTTASLNANSFTRAGYSFTGWYAKRNSDNKWYVSGKGWLSESEINSKGYSKKLYADKAIMTFNDSWTNGAKGNVSFTMYAQWKQMPFSFNSVGADNITSTDANIYATFNLQPIDSAGFYIGKSSSSLNKITKNLSGKSDGAGTFNTINYPLNNWYGTLTPSTTYYYKLYVMKGGKEYTTEVKSFTTKAAASSGFTFNSVGADSITETNANIYAKFDLQQIDGAGFYIGKSTSSLTKVSKSLSGKVDGAGNFYSINYPLNNWYGKLTPNTKYYYKLYVIKNGKECSTEVKSFTTKEATLTVKYNANGGAINSDRFKLVSGVVYDGSAVLENKWTYDQPNSAYGLWNAESFGLYRPGYTFVGWGTTASGGKIFDQDDTTVKPSDMSANIKNGSCTITLYAIWKQIQVAPTLDKENFTLRYKSDDTISVTNGVNVTWESSNPSVVSVDQYGNVTAKKKGSATITATAADGSTAECQVNVKMEWWQTLLKIISFGVY